MLCFPVETQHLHFMSPLTFFFCVVVVAAAVAPRRGLVTGLIYWASHFHADWWLKFCPCSNEYLHGS